jgi:hypothetical protein
VDLRAKTPAKEACNGLVAPTISSEPTVQP